MQKVWLLGLMSPFMLACEDGPTQVFQPAIPGAGDYWNDGKGSGVNDPSQQGFNSDIGGTNKVVLCTAEQQKAALSKAFAAPIEPPRKGGNLDLAGSDQWEGLTVEQAEKINCQSNDADVDVIYWGDNAELIAYFTVSTRKIYYLGFNVGYTGKITFKSRDGMNTYVLGVGNQIKKNNAPFTITWDSNPQTGQGVWCNEITDALFATFAPGFPAETNCLASGHCVRGNFGDQGYLYLPGIGFAMRVANINAGQPTPSVISYMDQYLARTLPFSFANPLLKVSGAGPTATALNLGPSKKTCTIQLGLTYGDWLQNCVETSGNAQTDTLEKTKALSGISHGAESISLPESGGIDLTFGAISIKPDDVVRDNDLPQAADPLTRFRVDQSTLGTFSNDYLGNDASQKKDLHMMGLVYAEFARSVQEKLNGYLPVNQRHNLGDPACLTGDLTQIPPAAGCTGFEGFMVPLAPSKISDPNLKKIALDPLLYPGDPRTSPLQRGIKPGHNNVVFCDGTNLSACYTVGDTFTTAYARIVSVLGKNDSANLPPEAQDARFLWREWSRAAFRYLIVEDGTGTATHDTVKNAPFLSNRENYEQVGGGQFEASEYVDRSGTIPMKISMTGDIRNGIFNDFTMSRYNFRGETALYKSTLVNRNLSPGQEDFLASNVFGSPALKNNWIDTSKATAYECAIGAKTLNDCDGQGPPRDGQGNVILDDFGQPLLTRYKGAFTSTGTLFRMGPYSPVTVKKEYPIISSVMVTFPQLSDPYDTASSPDNPSSVDFLIPWVKKQPGVGFHIPINGQQYRFVSGYDFDFGGATLSGGMVYDYVDPKNPAKGIRFEQVHMTDFYGDAFLCVDPKTGDLLRARMFTATLDIIDWIKNHPDALNACQLLVKYTKYNNYVDFVASITNGTLVHSTQGGGWGRINEIELWDPSL